MQEDTKLISKRDSTPILLKHTPKKIMHSNDIHILLYNICLAEFAARVLYPSDNRIVEVIEDETGLNYIGCYFPLHNAIQKMKKD